MDKFMGQFKNLTPGQVFALDNYIYAQGVRMLGRTAGNWESVKVGDVWALKLGDNDTVNCTTDGRVAASTPFQYVETDALTASVAFTALVVNWFWNENAQRMTDEANEEFERVHFGLRDGVWADNPTVKLNLSAYNKLTD